MKAKPNRKWLRYRQQIKILVVLFLIIPVFFPTNLFAEEKKKSFGQADYINRGLEGKIYSLAKKTRKLPTDWEKQEHIGTIYTDHLNVPAQSWKNGFPNVTDRFEWFAIVYTGRFHSKKSACYLFRLNSDDGAKLYIDNQLIIDNDGLHPPKSKTKKHCLDTKTHEIRLEYFQGPRIKIALQLFYQLVGEKNNEEQTFPGDQLVLDQNTPIPLIALGFSCFFALLIFLIILALKRKKNNKQNRKN